MFESPRQSKRATEVVYDQVHLVVHDFGGPFGLTWGLEHPDRWASVVLINVGVLPGYSWHTMARRWRTPVLGELKIAVRAHEAGRVPSEQRVPA